MIDVGYDPDTGLFDLEKYQVEIDKCNTRAGFKKLYDTTLLYRYLDVGVSMTIRRMFLDRMTMLGVPIDVPDEEDN